MLVGSRAMARGAGTKESVRLGVSLRAARDRLELTQQKAAALLGVSESTLQGWEAGRVQTIRQMHREQLANLYGGQAADYLIRPRATELEARVEALEAAMQDLVTPARTPAAEAPGLPVRPDEVARRLETARRTLEDHERRRNPPEEDRRAAAGE